MNVWFAGLDPAGPFFEGLLWMAPDFHRLESTDGKFVDVYHSSLVLGRNKNCGTVDVYINNAWMQPNCFNGE